MSALPELPRSIREVDDRAARDLDRLARMSERNQPSELTAQGSHDSQLRQRGTRTASSSGSAAGAVSSRRTGPDS
jgi:hypothetical protein